ncbi:MAG: hypothetical protein ABMA02_20225, partial [Saprospiraceae bacterium]
AGRGEEVFFSFFLNLKTVKNDSAVCRGQKWRPRPPGLVEHRPNGVEQNPEAVDYCPEDVDYCPGRDLIY